MDISRLRSLQEYRSGRCDNNVYPGPYPRVLIWATIVLIIWGCAPDVKHPDLNVLKSERWADSSQVYTPIDSAWWRGFNDKNLDSIITQAFQKNYTLPSAAAALEAAEARKTIAGADLFPSLNLSADAARREQSLVTFPPQIRRLIENPVNTFGVSANISWELDLWGRVRSARSAGAAHFEASLADYHGFRLSLAAQTIKAWFAAIEAERQYSLANENLENYTIAGDRIFARYEKGVRPSLDYRLSRTNIALAESQLYQRLQILEQSKRQLEIILGRYPAAKINLSESMPQTLTDIETGIPADILNRRPDVMAAERRLAAAHCNVWAAKAALFPRISLSGSAGSSTRDIGDLLNPDFTVWSLGANILQPIFQGGRLRANVQLNEAMQKQAFAAYAHTVLQAYAEIEKVIAADGYLGKQEVAIKTAADEARASFELAEDRYYNGLSDYITMLEAQRQANNAQSQLFAIRRLRIENRVDFYVALGGGYTYENQAE